MAGTLNTQTIPDGYADQFIVAKFVPYRVREYPSELIRCSCVNYSKWYTGVPLNETWGRADQIDATSAMPYIGGYILLNDGPYGHMAVITDIQGPIISITESNFKPCEITERQLNINSAEIRGFK